MTIYNLFKIPLTSAAGQWCRFAAIILFALCFVGVSGAAVIKFGEIKPPIASTMPTGQGFLGNDFEVTPPPARYAARNDEQLGLSPPRRIQMQGGRQLQTTPSQVVITLRADNIQVRARWQVSNANNAFYIDEYGDGALYLTADINNIVTLDVTVYLEDDFKLLNSAYDNLMAAATIRVEVMLGTISIINPPLLYAAAGVAEIVHIFLPQGGKRPYQYITPPNIPSGFAYENGTLSIQEDAVEGEYHLTVEIADARNITAMAVAMVTVESSHMIEVQNGGAVFISQGQEQSITNGIMFKFNPKSSSGVLVSATAESTVALMAPGNAWAITIYGGSQASFVGNGNGAVAVSLEGDSDFVRDTAAGAEVSLEYVFRRGGVVEAIVPITPTGTRIFCRSQGGEWYLVIDEGTAQFVPRGGVNFLALNDAEWLVDGQTFITAQEFKFDDFMIATVAHRYTGDVGSVIANYGVAPSFSLVNGAALVSDRIGTQYYPRHGAKVAVEGPQGPLTLSLPVVAEDHLGDMLGGYGYTNRMATVTATVVVGAPPVANFVGIYISNVIHIAEVAVGEGVIISITLSYPPQADHSVSLFVNSDTDDYTFEVLGSDAGISCDNGHCSLLIPEGQILAQLSVLAGTDISLSIVASDGEFVVRVYDEGSVCLRTQQVRDDIMSQAGKSDCTKVTSADLANITVMDLSYYGITSLQHVDFDGLDNLQYLYLNGNNLTTLPSGVFDGLDNLQYLYLNGNNLTTLPSGVFDGLDNLQYLYLNGNNLTTLPSGVFDGLDNLQYLRLSSNDLVGLPSDAFDNLVNLQWLYLHRNALTTLPDGVFDGLDDLKFLAVSHNTLAVLPDGVFDDLGNLLTLYSCCNALTDLPNGVFDRMGNLQHLDLYENALAALPADIFDKVKNLQDLELGRNDLSTLPDVFRSLGNLQYLDLTENALTTLPSGVFNGLGNLQKLYLYRNTLTALPNGVFDGLGNLQELNLWNNKIADLPADIFDEVRNLQDLELGRNDLSTLPDDVFNDLSNLRELHIYHNNLTELSSDVFDGLSSLEHLGVSYNTLAVLPDDVFDELGSLQTLYLNSNVLTTLPDGVFDSLGDLQHLSLSRNALTDLPSGVFDDLDNLQVLYLHRNDLTTLPSNVFGNLGSLQELYLNDNPGSCSFQSAYLGIGATVSVNYGC